MSLFFHSYGLCIFWFSVSDWFCPVGGLPFFKWVLRRLLQLVRCLSDCLLPCGVESAGPLLGPSNPALVRKAQWTDTLWLWYVVHQQSWVDGSQLLWLNVPVLASLIPSRSVWAEGEGFLSIMLTPLNFCIKELYLFVNIHVHILKGTVHIFKVCIIICEVYAGFCMTILTLGIKTRFSSFQNEQSS